VRPVGRDRRPHPAARRGKVSSILPNPLFDPIAKPGCLFEYFKGENPKGLDMRELFGELEPIRPEYRDRDARLRVMDEQGLAKALLFPTLGVLMEQSLEGDPEACAATFHAFNEWINDDWGFDRDGRIYSAAIPDARRSRERIDEVEWVLGRGAKLINVRSAPPPVASGATSPADPVFDPVWARIEEAGALLCTHLGSSTPLFWERWKVDTGSPDFAFQRCERCSRDIATSPTSSRW